jgi:hypothetical protein
LFDEAEANMATVAVAGIFCGILVANFTNVNTSLRQKFAAFLSSQFHFRVQFGQILEKKHG